MAREICYDWVSELVELHDDGVDETLEQEYAATYAQARQSARATIEREGSQHPDLMFEDFVGLVRYIIVDGQVQETESVYVQQDNRLPHTFLSGAAVPLKYRKEVDTFHRRVDWDRYEAETSVDRLVTEYDQARQQVDTSRQLANWAGNQRRGGYEEREYFYDMGQAHRAEMQRAEDRMAAIGLRLDALMQRHAEEA